MKEKKEIDLSEFDIYERDGSGACGYVSLANLHPDKPIITINKFVVTISKCVQDKIRVKKGDYVVFSRREGIEYMAVVPMDSKMAGYKVGSTNKSKSLYVSAFKIIKNKFKVGVYVLLEPIFVGGIDWFELEPFEDK